MCDLKVCISVCIQVMLIMLLAVRSYFNESQEKFVSNNTRPKRTRELRNRERDRIIDDPHQDLEVEQNKTEGINNKEDISKQKYRVH